MFTNKHYSGLLKKNVTLQLRQKKSNILVLCFNASLLFLLVFFQNGPWDQVKSFGGGYIRNNSIPAQAFDQFCYSTDNCFCKWFLVWVSNSNPSNGFGALSNTTSGQRTGLLGNVTQMPVANSEWMMSPFTMDLKSPQYINQNLQSLNTYINNEVAELQKQFPTSYWNNPTYVNLSFYRFPLGVINVNEYSLEQRDLDYVVQVPYETYNLVRSFSYDYDDTAHSLINMITNGFWRTVSGNVNVTVTTTAVSFPYRDYSTDYFGLASLLGLYFVPACLVFLMPLQLYTMVSEKHERLVELMKMMGMRANEYWISTYMFGYLFYLAIATLIVIILSIGQYPALVECKNPLIIIFMFVLYGFSQVSFTTFLSCFFWKPIPALLFGFALSLPGAASSAAFSFWKTSDAPIPFGVMLFPPIAFCRAWYLQNYATAGLHPPHMVDLTSFSPLVESFVAMIVTAFIYLVLTLYFDKVLPKEHGLNKSPLFPLFYIRDKLRSTKSQETLPLISSDKDGLPDIELDEDEDCQNERNKVRDNNDMLAKIVNLSKKYPSNDKYSLYGCSMAIEEGECLGLLGPNGAGKTTLISVLCGLTKPTSGYALVLNSDIRNNMHRVHELLGLCPQHSILWPDLTVEEHLLFYCALKNHGGDVAYLHVQKLAQEVGLSGESLHKRVSVLSGGYKRRLSIGIALVGSSRLVLLDEPTAGLDHTSRRAIWDIIERQKKAGRSFIITTHDMAEADVLCSRIAIISQGRLFSIGEPSHLKRKFGSGYVLKLTIDSEFSTTEATSRISEIFPSAVIQKNEFDTLEYAFSNNDTNLADLYVQLAAIKDQIGVVAWSVNPTSLEQVFLKLMQEDEAKGAQPHT